MIAGMLPVAIKQNADTRNDLTAKVVCDSGYAYLRTLIQTHPEAFPETCGERGAINGGEPFTPLNNSMLEEFMDDALMNLNPADDYTPLGSSPPAPVNVVGRELRAGRMMPLSYDVARPDATNAYNIASMTPVQRAAYPLAWHQIILGDRIVSSEPRFQWLAFYRRDEGSSVIKLIIVAMRQQTGEVVDRYRASSEPLGAGNATLPNERIGDPNGTAGAPTGNGPFLVPVEFEDSLTGPDIVKFLGTPGTSAWDVDVAETGAFLIIAHSPPLNGNTATGDLNRPYRNNGKIFRLGARRDEFTGTEDGRVWELQPGFDLSPADAGVDQIIGTPDDIPDGSMNQKQLLADNNTPAIRQAGVTQYPVSDTVNVPGTRAYAWIIGRGHLDPTTGSGPYVGATQDLGVLAVDVPLP